jgi:hypothetical protein
VRFRSSLELLYLIRLYRSLSRTLDSKVYIHIPSSMLRHQCHPGCTNIESTSSHEAAPHSQSPTSFSSDSREPSTLCSNALDTSVLPRFLQTTTLNVLSCSQVSFRCFHILNLIRFHRLRFPFALPPYLAAAGSMLCYIASEALTAYPSEDQGAPTVPQSSHPSCLTLKIESLLNPQRSAVRLWDSRNGITMTRKSMVLRVLLQHPT